MKSIMYVLYKVIRDANGQIVDARIVEANEKFCQYYHVDSDPEGLLRSAILPSSHVLICELMNRALASGNPQVQTYSDDTIGDVMAIIEPAGIDMIALCSFDAKMAVHEGIKVEREARKYAMLFQLMDGIIWEWDVKKQECESTDAIYMPDFHMNGARIDERTGHLVWTFEGMMSSIYEEDRKALSESLVKYLAEPESRFISTFRMETGDGIRNVEVRICVDSYDEAMKPAKFIGFTRFI